MTVHLPTSLPDALGLLAERPGRLVLAGGTDLMVTVNEGHRVLSAETEVVALDRVPELTGWEYRPATVAGAPAVVRVGAMSRWSELETGVVADWSPALAQAARTVGSPQIRAAGTIGGNVATSSPAGDGLPVLSALDAVVHLVSAAGERDVPFAEFATGPKRTVLAPGELVAAVSVPVLDGWQGYSKVGVRNAMVISTASACFAHDRTGGSVRLALGSVGPVVLRCTDAEEFVQPYLAGLDGGATLAEDVVDEFARLAREAARPIDDHRSTAAYRRHAVGVLAARLLRRAFPNG